MGTCFQTTDVNHTKIIDDELQIERKKVYDYGYHSSLQNIILVGTQGSGKTTFMKQLKYIYGKGYDEKDKYKLMLCVYKQCIDQMKTVIDLLNNNTYNTINKDIGLSIDAFQAKEFIMNTHDSSVLTDKIVESIKILWNEPAVKHIFSKHINMNKVQHSSAYFWDNIDRISQLRYNPSEQDMCRVYSATSKIEQQHFCHQNTRFCCIIINGQEMCKPKWMEYFEYNTECIIFVASLSCYDSPVINSLELLVYGYIANNCFDSYIPKELITLIINFYDEIQKENEMTKQLQLFDTIGNHFFFKNSTKTLLLNKVDIFEEKIRNIRINVCPLFEQYDGNGTFDDSAEFIRHKFTETITSVDRNAQIYTHMTCAIDMHHTEKVFNDIFHSLMYRNYDTYGGLI
eukprot:483051_1